MGSIYLHVNFLTFLAICWGQDITCSTPANEPDSPLRYRGFETYTDCGGVLPISLTVKSSRLEYKSSEYSSGSEFCVWTLLPDENVENVRFIINTIPTVRLDGITAYFWDENGLTPRSFYGDHTDVIFKTPPRFITFKSFKGTEVGGFVMEIQANGTDGVTRERGFHVEMDQGEFSYPRKPSEEEESEGVRRVSVVVTGAVTKRQGTKKITLRDVASAHGEDFIEIYTLWGYESANPKYVQRARINGNQTVEFPVDNYLPTVILSTYKRSIAGKGFRLSIDNYRHKET